MTTRDGTPDEYALPMASDLRVGASGRFQGIYHLHWEWTRFEFTVAVPSRWWRRRRRVLGELIPDPAPLPKIIQDVLEPADPGKRFPGASFAVTVDADIVDHGHFGHLGTLRWRLAVRRWVTVEQIRP